MTVSLSPNLKKESVMLDKGGRVIKRAVSNQKSGSKEQVDEIAELKKEIQELKAKLK